MAGIAALGVIKMWSNNPVDLDGKVIFTKRDQIMGFSILALALAATIFVRSNHFTKNVPIALCSMLLIGATVFWMRQHRSQKK